VIPQEGQQSSETVPPDRLFPAAEKLVDAPLEEIGLTRARAATLRLVARTFLEQPNLFDPDREAGEFVRRFSALRGIGPWTAHYVAMRALHAPDAFPASDLVLRKRLATEASGVLPTVAEVERRAAAWKPYRAYAAMLLWRTSATSIRPQGPGGQSKPNN